MKNIRRSFVLQNFIITLLLCTFQFTYISSQDAPLFLSNLDTMCLRCLCHAATGCNTTIGCISGYCGPLKISRIFWIDADRAVLPEDDPQRAGAFEDCALNFNCATKLVKNYISKYGRDCNGDGAVNCDDFAMIHFNGGVGCYNKVDASDAGIAFLTRYNGCNPRSP